jgi:hypothetical protein
MLESHAGQEQGAAHGALSSPVRLSVREWLMIAALLVIWLVASALSLIAYAFGIRPRSATPATRTAMQPIHDNDPGDETPRIIVHATASERFKGSIHSVATTCPKCSGVDVVRRESDGAIWCHGCQNVFHPHLSIA